MKIEIKNISKKYNNKNVLLGLDLKINQGEIYCLLGKNGAGKTTLINILINLIRQDKGEILYNDKKYEVLPLYIKQNIGVLNEENSLIEELTAIQFLALLGKIYKIDFDTFEQRKNDLISYFFDDSEEVDKKQLSQFSTGMKKKMGIIAAALHRPDLLILDEPFSGLDPIAAKKTIDFINFYRSNDRTVFLSSHDLANVKEVATNIVVLDQCKFIFSGSITQFTQNGLSEISNSLLKMLQPDDNKSIKPEWL